MSGSKLTLRQSFFDDLWPYILWDNVCDTHSTNTSEYFVPLQRFDNIWGHALLAEKGYKNYFAPTEMRCCFDEKVEAETESASTAIDKTETEEDEQESKEKEDIVPTHVTMDVPVDQQIDALEKEHEKRRHLANAFVNRQYPWFMKRPRYEEDFHITDDTREQFCCTFEFSLLQEICDCNCKLMIIDFSEAVCLHEIERWIKFKSYVFIIILVRSEDAVRKVRSLGEGFSSVLCVDDLENAWQEQLTSDLNTGMAHAMSLGLLEECSKLVAFVFPRVRSRTTTDTFRILRRA